MRSLWCRFKTGAREGMQSLDQHLKTLVKLRRIRPEEALARAVDKESFRQDRMAAPSMGGGGDSVVRPPTTSRSVSG